MEEVTMKIRIINKGNRNQLICKRHDETTEIVNLGPDLPFHDIAHFVVEQQLNLQRGFYGNINNGYTVKQLSDKEIIKTLPVESAVSEIVTRALQSLSTGSCSISQFKDLIAEEFSIWSINYSIALYEEEIRKMLTNYQNLVEQWNQLNEGESLDLEFDITNNRH